MHKDIETGSDAVFPCGSILQRFLKNIGTGNGSSVLQVKNTFEQINGVPVAFEFAPRRAGDVAISFADNTRAIAELGWKPQYTLQDMLADSWNWQKQNPNGYQ